MRRSKDLLFYGRLTPVLFDVVVCTPLLGLPFLPCRIAPVPFGVVICAPWLGGTVLCAVVSVCLFCVVSLLLSLSVLWFARRFKDFFTVGSPLSLSTLRFCAALRVYFFCTVGSPLSVSALWFCADVRICLFCVVSFTLSLSTLRFCADVMICLFCAVSFTLSLSMSWFFVPLSVVTHFMLLVLPCPF